MDAIAQLLHLLLAFLVQLAALIVDFLVKFLQLLLHFIRAVAGNSSA